MAHGRDGAGLDEPLGVADGGVLAAALAVLHQPVQLRPAPVTAVPEGVLERLQRQFGAQVIGQRLADDPPGEHVDDQRQVEANPVQVRM
ncbi:hypothetical protein SAMN05421810_11827 [Amycolatopsis arida]|uniref:Uncharacterized protein n=1 Tax=Amycolatopsis arida TaxID=587909 RepID=A0A1I6B1T4_9PSEU|nr:hypothetical protein CLV69_1193 [Amycolatopsis arida]SFQ74757.1 hypothetical protein SAMN05421810_11827 [Amycolatopsis arida]